MAEAGQLGVEELRAAAAADHQDLVAVEARGGEEGDLVAHRLQAGRPLDLDPVEFRRKNFVQPEDMPYETPNGCVYDSGDYPRAMDMALELIGADSIEERRAEAAARGKLLGLGIDITREPIPVVPAQHYTCGGVLIDIDGKTDAPGLYAAGEVTQSGLHGANRLASNSLLECLVFGEAAARHVMAHWDSLPEPPPIRPWDESRVEDSDEQVVIQQCWGEIRRFMWNFVGIVRTTKRLERAKHRIDLLRQEVADYYKHFRVTADLIELRNLVEVADLIIRSALSRHESRGLHYTLDYPEMASDALDTILVP